MLRPCAKPRKSPNGQRTHDHQDKGAWFWGGCEGSHESVGLSVETCGEVKDTRVSSIATVSESESPKTLEACIAYDLAAERTGCRIKCVDLASGKAEVSDQKIISKSI